MSAEPIWKETFSIRSYESTPEGTASLQSICNYLQEAAGNHARALGFSIEQLNNLTWVLARLKVQLSRPPWWREQVAIETWPSGHDGLRATRDFILRVGDEEIGRATSIWYMIDLTRRRPVRIPDAVKIVHLPEREPALPHDFALLRAPDSFEAHIDFRVRYSDLDVNQHVNNVRYVEWALEGIDRRALPGYHVGELDVVFKAETVGGEVVHVATARTSAIGDAVDFFHRLTVKDSENEVALVATRWVSGAST